MDDNKETTVSKNIVKIEDAGPCKKKVSVEIPEEAIKDATDEQYRDMAKEAEVPGFRKGRAPRRLLEKRFGKETTDQIKLKLLADATDSAVKDNEIKVLREPDVDFEKIELPESGSMTFDFEVEVHPEFDLPELEGIEVTRTKLEITDEKIDTEIEQLQKWSGAWTPRDDGAVQQGDKVIANAVLKVEGVEEDQKLDNIEVQVRENGSVGPVPVEGLDKMLVGAKVGDSKETSIEVAKTYFNEEYRGKKVDIQIDIKDIKWLKPAEMNEDLFKRYGVGDADELREKINDHLQNRLEQQSREEMTEQIYNYMLENTDFELSTNIVADQATMLLRRQYAGLLQRGISKEELEEEMEQLQAGSEEEAKKQLKMFFIMDKVSEKLKIEVTDEEINGHVAQAAIQRGMRPEKMREDMLRDGTLAQFSIQVRDNKGIAKLLESAKIKDVKPKKAAKKVEKAAEKAEKTAKKSPKKAVAAKKEVKKTAKKKTSK